MEALVGGITFVDSENGRQYRVKLIPENQLTDDPSNRFPVGPIAWREEPLPFTFSDREGEPHEEARHVGNLVNIHREEIEGTTWVVANLDWDNDELALEAKRLVDEDRITGVSIHATDLDAYLICGAPDNPTNETILAAAEAFNPDECPLEDWVEAWLNVVLGSATLLMLPAFEEAEVVVASDKAILEPGQYNIRDNIVLSNGAPTIVLSPSGGDDTEQLQNAINLMSKVKFDDKIDSDGKAWVAAVDLMRPPADWFTTLEPEEPTAVIVTDEGQVFGHLTEKDCHRGFFDSCVLPPDDAANFEEFHNNGTVYLDNGETLRVGNLTIDLNHADVRASADKAKAHYDNSGAVVAQVRASQGVHGIWLSGALAPWATPEQIEKLKRLRLSGDWRPTRDGRHYLIAAQAVAVPGFPIRARVASGTVEEYTTLGPENPVEEPLFTEYEQALVAGASDLALISSALIKTNAMLGELLAWKREMEYREIKSEFDTVAE